MFDTVYDSVIPLVKSKYADNVQIIFRQQIQPWHPSSTLVHEGGVAVLQTNPDKFWEFSKVWWLSGSFRFRPKSWHTTGSPMGKDLAHQSKLRPSSKWVPSSVLTALAPQALFDKQTEYFDVNVVNETRNNTYSRLSKLASTVGLDEKKIYSLLEISDKPGEDGSLNSGNKVTNDIKLLTKANRLTGVHVTPTVLFNVSETFEPCC
jgi:hypothetical protein